MPLTALPKPSQRQGMTLEQALAARRTIRSFAPTPLSLAHIAQLMWAAQGITGPEGRRTTPSAGALFCLEMCVAVGSGEEYGASVYRYRPEPHALESITERDVRAALGKSAIGEQPWLGQAAIVVILAASEETIVDHFKDQPPLGRRGHRYISMEIGQAAQNLYLQATALGLGSVFVGGFDDKAILRLGILSVGQMPYGLMAIGHPL